MECPCRWATLYLFTYLSLHVANGSCQNIPLVQTPPEVLSQPQAGNREVPQTPNPSKAQLINALFSYATAKGLLPKTTQITQSTPQVKPSIATSQNTPKTLNDVSFQPQTASSYDVKPSVSSTQGFTLNTILNQISPPTTSYSQTMMLQPKSQTEPISWTFSPKTSQMGYVENFAGAQPSQTVSVNPISNQVSPPATPYSQTMMLQPTSETETISWTFSPKTSQMGYVENFAGAQPSQTVSVNPISNQVTPPLIPYSQTMTLQPTLQSESVSWAFSPKTSQMGYIENFSSAQPFQTVPVNPISNQVSPPVTPYSQTMMLQPTSETETISWTFSPKTSQMGYVENFSGTQPSQTVSVKPILNQVSPPTTTYYQTMMLQPTSETEPISWTFSPKTSQMGYVENFSGTQPSQTVSVKPILNQVSPPTTTYYQTMMLQPTSETEPISWTFSPKPSQMGYVENFAGTQQSQIVSVNPILNQISPPTTTYSQTTMLQPTSETETISWTFSPKPSQMGYVENLAGAQPSQTLWHPLLQPPQQTSINNYLPNDQVIFNEATSPYSNLQISSPTYTLTPTPNTGYRTVENVYETNCGVLVEEPEQVTKESGQSIPISLKINIPSPNDQCPTITIVNPAVANPEPVVACSLYSLPPPPPVIMKRSRSSLRKLLPIILLALIDDFECCGGFDCSCNCGSDDPILIPYPIPVPVNSPMVNVGCN